MTVLFELPGVLTDTTGLQQVIKTTQGFPSDGLEGLHLFTDGAGTSIANAVSGGSAGLTEAPFTGAYGASASWLSGGGGLQVSGTQIVSFPAFVPTGPFSLVYCGGLSAHLSGASEAVTALLNFRDRSTGVIRGPLLLARQFTTGGSVGYAQLRQWSGAADSAASNLTPINLALVGMKFVGVLSYNGADTVTATLYNKTGAVIASQTISATDAGMVTSGGVTVSTVQPAIGQSNAVYTGGVHQIEAFARYNRVLTVADIQRIAAKSAALGAARGRAWA